MSAGRKFEIKDHLSVQELNFIIKDSKIQSKVCKRVIFIKMLLQGSTIKEVSKVVGVERQTGDEWLKRYNSEGYDGLIPKFASGKPGKLSENQKNELKNILIDENSVMTN